MLFVNGWSGIVYGSGCGDALSCGRSCMGGVGVWVKSG